MRRRDGHKLTKIVSRSSATHLQANFARNLGDALLRAVNKYLKRTSGARHRAHGAAYIVPREFKIPALVCSYAAYQAAHPQIRSQRSGPMRAQTYGPTISSLRQRTSWESAG